jgi:OOP family OmpA-OmpF porin
MHIKDTLAIQIKEDSARLQAIIDSKKDGFIVIDLLTYGASTMQKTFLTAICIAVLVLSGCAVSKNTSNMLQDDTKFDGAKIESLAPLITSGAYVQRANNLFVVFDASSSATEDYAGVGYKANNEPTKLEVQREILHRMNQTITNSASALKLSDFKTGIRSFGYGDCKGYGDRYTDLHQAPTLYAKDAFDTATDTIGCSHGRSHIFEVLNTVGDDLATTTGNISLVIVSDLVSNKLSDKLHDFMNNNYHNSLGDGEEAIKALRVKYGDRLCVYNVWTGEESESFGAEDLDYSQNPPSCGQPNSATGEKVAESAGLKDFMRAVLLSPVPPPPAPDCSQLDSDGDGVNDCDDKCPNTIKGTPVNRLGCWIVDVKFDNDRSEIKPQYFALLNKLAVDITANFSNLTLEIQGHTSSTASAAYNMRLSTRRANAVTEYLNKRLSGPHKLVPHGYGLTRPIDTNETAAGRANNRRVQIEVLQ